MCMCMYVCVCVFARGIETSTMKRFRPELGFYATETKKLSVPTSEETTSSV